MSTSIFNLLTNLKPFQYHLHYSSWLINKNWVLVNGINNTKAVYVFIDQTTLQIIQKENTIKTTWNIDTKNTFSIKTQDGKTTVKVYFKDKDILVFKKPETKECAIFINENNYTNTLNSIKDVQEFLHEKYKTKASSIIAEHQFYYIEKSEEFGPFTVEQLTKKVNQKTISEYCFVRDINENNYNNRLRIRDLIKVL